MGISISEAQALLRLYYNIQGEINKLPGEADYNFHIKSDSGETFTLKISPLDTNEQNILLQTSIIRHLANFHIKIPGVIKTCKGFNHAKTPRGNFIRLQEWVPGTLLGDVNPITSALLFDWGCLCGQLSSKLQDFDHVAAHRFYTWNPSETLHSKKLRTAFTSTEQKETADYFWDLFENETLSKLKPLRKSVNYNDAHGQNILVTFTEGKPHITGLIDFGDALYTETINELAIACAYAGMAQPDPIEAMRHVVRGYNDNFSILEDELEVLFSLIAARLLITVASAAHNKKLYPENEYLIISEKPAWDLLFKLKNIDPQFAHHSFRQACNYPPNPLRFIFDKWVAANADKITSPIKIKQDDFLELDLCVGSLDLGNNSQYETEEAFAKTIRRLLEDHETDTAVGGYNEARPIYTTNAYKAEGNHGSQWRTVHLGLDIWQPGGTLIRAPLNGIVVTAFNNDLKRDYGPTIILRHDVSAELSFFTLYGHLTKESLSSLNRGDLIKQGDALAYIGYPNENGGWPSHLHFQILLDLFGNKTDFPGAAFPHEANIYLSNCPNPSIFFQLPEKDRLHSEADDILSTRQQHLGKSLSISYAKPLHIVRGYKQYLYDATGRRYLDTVNNVAHVGHEHPRVIRAAQRQNAILNTNTRYLHPQITSFATELLATFPSELSVVHFVNSGSEANELALRMAEACTQSQEMIAIEVGYHGNTSGCVGISSYKFDGIGGSGAPDHCHIVPIPDTYRGLYSNVQNPGIRYASHVASEIAKITARGKQIGGFICESIISCGGQIVLPENYLAEAYNTVRAAGGICIADEVQVGFGRVGTHFWGFELQHVIPDIVTLGKPIGNGHPLAAVVTTEAVANKFANGMEYFNTFGGNPVSCAVGREVLNIIHDEKLQAHALQVGNYLLESLRDVQNQFSIIGDVRGHGLFLGFELVEDRKTLDPAAAKASYLVNRMRERGILMSTDGPLHNVIKIKPPMCFDFDDSDYLIKNLELILNENSMQI